MTVTHGLAKADRINEKTVLPKPPSHSFYYLKSLVTDAESLKNGMLNGEVTIHIRRPSTAKQTFNHYFQ